MWPFRKGRADSPRVEAITADTPRRFSITLADAAATDRARAVLAERQAAELTITPRRDTVGRTVLDLESTFIDGVAAVLRPLNQLHYGNVDVAGVELNDLVTDVDDVALAQAVEEWAANGNIGPYRKRLERLAGAGLLQRSLARAAGADNRVRSAWWLAIRLTVFNTPAAEGVAVAEAARSQDASAGRLLIDAAIERVNLVRLARMEAEVPMEPLAELLRRPGYLAERACHLVWSLPAPVDPMIAGALRDLVARGGAVATAAMTALHEAEPTTGLRTTVDAALASDEAEVRASALALLARHWPNDARPVWREFLRSRSAPLRLTAESVLGLHGDEQDLADAAAQLVKLSRGAGTDTSPPRGHEIVELLLRHREHPSRAPRLSAWRRTGRAYAPTCGRGSRPSTLSSRRVLVLRLTRPPPATTEGRRSSCGPRPGSASTETRSPSCSTKLRPTHQRGIGSRSSSSATGSRSSRPSATSCCCERRSLMPRSACVPSGRRHPPTSDQRPPRR